MSPSGAEDVEKRACKSARLYAPNVKKEAEDVTLSRTEFYGGRSGEDLRRHVQGQGRGPGPEDPGRVTARA
jgi:hypothetical protein